MLNFIVFLIGNNFTYLCFLWFARDIYLSSKLHVLLIGALLDWNHFSLSWGLSLSNSICSSFFFFFLFCFSLDDYVSRQLWGKFRQFGEITDNLYRVFPYDSICIVYYYHSRIKVSSLKWLDYSCFAEMWSISILWVRFIDMDSLDDMTDHGWVNED